MFRLCCTVPICTLWLHAWASAQLNGPYPLSERPVKHLHAISEQGRNEVELLCLDSLAGNLARESPRLYRVASAQWSTDKIDPSSVWLQDMKIQKGIDVNDSLLTAPLLAILQAYKTEVEGYVRCNAKDASASAAVTFAAAGSGILVGGDNATVQALDAAGLKMIVDFRGKKVADMLDNHTLKNLSEEVFVFQDPVKSQWLADYSIFARAAYLKFSSEPDVQKALLERSSKVGVAWGWGPENEYVTTCNQHGVYVHASDYNKNLPALSNVVRANLPSQLATAQIAPAPSASTHSVAFLMTDGDNLQWTLGPWSTDAKWYGNSKRGSFPMGWTLSPAIAYVAPLTLERIVRERTVNDELVAGPSGVGYMYPTQWPKGLLRDFADLTFEGMNRAGMSLINVLGQGDDAPNKTEDVLKPLLANDNITGMLYYPWGDGYSQLHGQVWTMSGKPVVSGRFSLWGNGADHDMVNVTALVARLKAMPKSPNTIEGYSLIPVNAWSHTFDDVAAVVATLREAGGFDFVLPSELLRRIASNVHPQTPVTPSAVETDGVVVV